jgi:hypothetical protein
MHWVSGWFFRSFKGVLYTGTPKEVATMVSLCTICITDHSSSPSGESASGCVMKGLMLRLGFESTLVRFFSQVV